LDHWDREIPGDQFVTVERTPHIMNAIRAGDLERRDQAGDSKARKAVGPVAATPVKKPATPAKQVAKKKKPTPQVAKKKRPAKSTAKKRAAPKPSAPKLKSGKKQSAIWSKIILPYLDGIVEKEGSFDSLGRARDAAKERLKDCKKGLSDSAIERGIKRNRPLWCLQWA